MEKAAKQAAAHTANKSSVIAQIRELVWVGQPTKVFGPASYVANLFQALED